MNEEAGWWRRVAAWMVDLFILVTALSVVYLFLLNLFGDNITPVILLVLFPLLWLLLPSLYWGFLMSREENNGQSVGKQLLGIRVIREDGEAVDFGYALWRQVLLLQLFFGTLLGILSFGIIPLLNYCSPLWDDKKKAFHDKMVRSRVVLAS